MVHIVLEFLVSEIFEVLFFGLLLAKFRNSYCGGQFEFQPTQQSNQEPQESNQTPQKSNQTPQEDLALTIVEGHGEQAPEPDIIAVDTTTAIPVTTTIPILDATLSELPETFTDDADNYHGNYSGDGDVEYYDSNDGIDDNVDDNTCSNATNGEIFFEQVEIFDTAEFECSNEFNAKQFQYRTSTEAFEACKERTDCIAVTSTHLVIIAPELDSLDFNGEIDNEEIVNFMLPDGFDFENDHVFVKQCFSTRETDTDEFKELETLDCNAEVVCSSGYRQKNFDCVDVNECKLAHDCTFEGQS